MASPHALVLPYPAQGHVIPLVELSHCLVDHGFKITFVNTDFNHSRVAAALSESGAEQAGRIRLVPVADGMAEGEDRNNLVRLNDAMQEAMPEQLKELVERSGETEHGEITCVIADVGMSWALDITKRMGLPSAAFWAASAAVLAVLTSAPKLIQDGVIDADGSPKVEKMFQLSKGMPPMDISYLAWNFIGDRNAQRLVFHFLASNAQAAADNADLLLCNSFLEIEPSIFTYAPNMIPIGPLATGRRPGKAVGHFWRPEDETCMLWLDEQPARSVVYVAFGSFTIVNPAQFQELALGLEASGRPFLWVVRPGLTERAADALPDGFEDRVAGRGKIVEWSPQQKVLAHPSVACFVTHCGWNSTLEGVRNGVPLICWPYFTDQFANQTYICDVWKIGLRAAPDEHGLVPKGRINSRLMELLTDDGIKERAQKLKEMARGNVSEGGNSLKNLNSFIEAMKR